jgi:hypothetical protein
MKPRKQENPYEVASDEVALVFISLPILFFSLSGSFPLNYELLESRGQLSFAGHSF